MTAEPHRATPASREPPRDGRRIALVLGGGGLKGFAHIGVLRALEEIGVVPTSYAGTSIGALIAAARAADVAVDDMATRAIALRRRDLFRLNHVGMLLGRLRVGSIYQSEPLRALTASVVPDIPLRDFRVPVYVNTVDVEHGTQVVWGRPGLEDVSAVDAVYASCALPGFFPPGRVDGRLCVDGGTLDNTPVSIAALDADVVIAVDVGNADLTADPSSVADGFAAIFMRSASVMMHQLQLAPLTHWRGPPMVLLRPRVSHIPWFSFDRTEQLIEAGYLAAREALAGLAEYAAEPGGVFPRRRYRLGVDQDRCTGCGLCVSMAPELMAFDQTGKAFALTNTVDWSPADGDFVRHCPTNAIRVAAL